MDGESIERRTQKEQVNNTMVTKVTKGKKVGHTRGERTTVHVYLPREVLEKIKAEAAKNGLNASAWVRMQALKAAEKN